MFRYDEEPHCDNSGLCKAPRGARDITNCIYCGKELVEINGGWYTWDWDLHGDEPGEPCDYVW